MTNADYQKAQDLVKRAVRDGKIVKGNVCAHCEGEFPTHLLSSAHDDPREVFKFSWLCRTCHSRWRRARSGEVREDRRCKHCREVIPHEGESDAEYAKRVFCGQECYRAYRRGAPAKKVDHDPCEYCGGEVVRREGELTLAYSRRRYCSLKCSKAGGAAKRWAKTRAEKARILATKRCEGCGGRIQSHGGESLRDLEARKYCSVECPGLNELKRGILAQRNREASKNATGRSAQKRAARKRLVKRVNEEARRYAKSSGPVKLPEPRRHRESEPIRMVPEFEVKYCDKHPTSMISIYGKCPACVTAERWASREREIVARPSTEGGR